MFHKYSRIKPPFLRTSRGAVARWTFQFIFCRTMVFGADPRIELRGGHVTGSARGRHLSA
jgi:hypothetical protein